MPKRLERVVGPACALELALTVSTTAHAELFEIGPGDDLRGAIGALTPGDELILGGGTYTLDYRLGVTVTGTADQPIVVRSRDGETAHMTRDAAQNTINVEDAEYLVLRGLEVSGGSHGIRISASSFITVEDCHIHDTADVGLSANVGGSMYEGLVIRHNHIHHTGGTGEGMYLGCNDNACTMWASLIESNYVHDTNGPDVSQGDGIEIKDGSWGNVVRDNVIHDTNYPCILVYGAGGNAANVIERNVMWGCGDHAIQAAAEAVIRNNVILGPVAANGIHSQNHQSAVPGNLEIVHNTIVVNNDAVRINAPNAPVLIANNALYSQGGNAIQAGGDAGYYTIAGNLGVGATQNVAGGFDTSGEVAIDFVNVDFAGTGRDAYPAAGSALIGAGDTSYVAEDDFNGTLRAGQADVGAYLYEATGNPGWVITEDFKNTIPGGGSGGGGTAGVGASGTSGSGGTGGGATASGGSSGTAENSGSGDTSDDGACGCRAAGSGSPSGAAWLVAALVAAGATFPKRRTLPGSRTNSAPGGH